MRRLLMVSAAFPPSGQPGTHRILRFTRHLVEMGWDVHVLTLDPRSYREGTPIDPGLVERVPKSVRVVRTPALRWRWGRRQPNSRPPPVSAVNGAGAHASTEPPSVFRRVKTFLKQAVSTPDREIGWIGFAVMRAVHEVRREGIGTILSSAPPFSSHLVARLVKLASGVRWVADFRDPWARAPWRQAELAGSWRGSVNRALERTVVEAADAVVLNNEWVRREFVAHYGEKHSTKFHALTNGYDADVVAAALDGPVDAARSGPLVITHCGTLYGGRNPKPLLEAASRAIGDGALSAESLKLRFVGKVDQALQSQVALDELGLTSVAEFIPPVSHAESLRYLSESDVLLLIQPGTRLQVPAKLFEYMPLEKPVLALAEDGAASEVVEQGGLGAVVSPDDVEAIAETLGMLYENRDSLDHVFERNEEYIRNFEGRALTEKLEEILLTL